MSKFIVNGASLTGKELFGVQRYAIEILKELDKLVPPGFVEVVTAQNCENNQNLSFDNIAVVSVAKMDCKFINRIRWKINGFGEYVRKNHGIGIDLTLGLPFRGCDIVCIHDCIRELFPQNQIGAAGAIKRRMYIHAVRHNIRKCKKLITVSEYSKKDIKRIYHTNKEIAVIPNAWQHFERIKENDSIINELGLSGQDYFFALGSRYYHKNFKWIAEAARQNQKYKFVISGAKPPVKSVSQDETNDISNLQFTGYLSDEEIKALMAHCRAFIQPSLYEGFGIPPMEAMSTGARCIVSNTSSLPEIYDSSVWYIDPLKYDDIDLDTIMSSDIQPNYIVLRKYSWTQSAQLLFQVLKSY